MTGMFEVFIDENEGFSFRLKAPDGTVVAVSISFPDKPAAVCGIRDLREYAGMGLITDLCPEVPHHASPDVPSAPKQVVPALVPQPPVPQPPVPQPPAPQLPLPQRHHAARLQKERAIRPWRTGSPVDAPCTGLVEA